MGKVDSCTDGSDSKQSVSKSGLLMSSFYTCLPPSALSRICHFCISLCKGVSQVKGKYEDPYLVIAWPPPITTIIAIVTTSGLYFLHIVPAVTSPERPSGVQQRPTEQSSCALCTLHGPSKTGSRCERANRHSTSSTH